MPHPTDVFLSPDAFYRILTVDDEPTVLAALRATLEGAGYDVQSADSAAEALRVIERYGLPHLAIVDIKMPKVDGLQLCRQLHKYSDLPVILLTALSEERTVAKSIRDVAEDYVVKPFRPQELLARIERVLRRMADFSYALGRHTVIDDYLTIDFPGQAVLIDGQARELTPTETKILFILVRSAGRTTTADYLVRRIWPMKQVFEDTLRVHVHRLRHKLEPEPNRPAYLVTKRGTGYSFSSPAKASES